MNDLLRLLDRMLRTFSVEAPPVTVHSRRELVRVVLAHRLERRTLSRLYQRFTGETIASRVRAQTKGASRAA